MSLDLAHGASGSGLSVSDHEELPDGRHKVKNAKDDC